VLEAQDDLIDESVFASGMKTGDLVFTSITNARPQSFILAQSHAII